MGLQEEFGIQVVAGLRDDDPVTAKAVEDIGLKNLGKLGVIEFYAQLSKSFVLLGVGRPRISPSPWDALCMGVPVSDELYSFVIRLILWGLVYQSHLDLGRDRSIESNQMARSTMAHD